MYAALKDKSALPLPLSEYITRERKLVPLPLTPSIAEISPSALPICSPYSKERPSTTEADVDKVAAPVKSASTTVENHYALSETIERHVLGAPQRFVSCV